MQTERIKKGRGARAKLVERQTPAELALAAALKQAREPFTAQCRVQTYEADSGFYVVDFYLPRRRLLVELDGAPHFTERGKWRDRLRSEAIRRAKPHLTLVRFVNGDVLADPSALVRFLRSYS